MKARKFSGSTKNFIEQYQPLILKDRKYSVLNAQSPTQSKKNTMVSTNTLINIKTTTSQTTSSGRPGADTSMTVKKSDYLILTREIRKFQAFYVDPPQNLNNRPQLRPESQVELLETKKVSRSHHTGSDLG